MKSIGEFLSRVNSSAKPINKERTALIFRDKRLTYQELNLRTNQLANSLMELGIVKGDRVACLLFNCAEYWEIYFACAKIGAIVVPLNFRLAAPEVDFAINDSGPKILIFGEAFQKMVKDLENSLPTVKHCVFLGDEGGNLTVFDEDDAHMNYENLMKGNVEEPRVDVGFEDDLFIMYTSGTTGMPKGSLWTHGNALWFSTSQVVEFGYNCNDVSLVTGPLYHVGSLQDVSMPTFHMGGTCIILQSKGFDVRALLQVLSEEKVTKTLLFPVMLYDVLALPDLDKYDLSSLKMILSGGEPVPVASIQAFQDRLPNANLVQVYGLTEGTPIATSCPSEFALEKTGSAGKATFSVDIKIVDDDENILAPGEIGEILTKGPSVSKGYWKRPEANAEIFVDGWCHTGDLGRLDDDGFLFIEGRKKDMIISGAENIYPAEIEGVLFKNPKIHDVAVIGVPDQRWGEAVMAVIVPMPDETITEDEVVNFCKERMASYKKPRYVVFTDSLPRTPSQKVKKFVLREQYEHLTKQET